MPVLVWSDDLALAHPQMDTTHQAFVECLGALEQSAQAPFEQRLAALDALIHHCVDHFGQEDQWMAATGFAPDNCHSSQHTQVLEVLREVRARVADQAQWDLIDQLLPGMAQWFEQHAKAADAALAGHLRETGFDTRTGSFAHGASPTPAEGAVTGCGSGACAIP